MIGFKRLISIQPHTNSTWPSRGLLYVKQLSRKNYLCSSQPSVLSIGSFYYSHHFQLLTTVEHHMQTLDQQITNTNSCNNHSTLVRKLKSELGDIAQRAGYTTCSQEATCLLNKQKPRLESVAQIQIAVAKKSGINTVVEVCFSPPYPIKG